MDDKLDKILDLLRSQNEMIKDIHDYVKEVTSEKYIGESRMTNTYQIYRSILHQLAIDENWNNVYSNITLPSGDMGTIKVERVDDERESKGV